MSVDDKLFHGVTFTDWEFVNGMDEFDLLGYLFDDGLILTRNSLENKHPFMYRSLAGGNFNSDNRVSVCCHESVEEEYAKSGSDLEFMADKDSAFSKFVKNNFSIILDKSVLDNYKYSKSGMLGEYQIYGDISLDYVKAIGMPNYYERIINEVSKILDSDNYMDYKYNSSVQKLKLSCDVLKFLSIGYSQYEKLKHLLEIYNYDIPIVDPVTGLEWLSQEEMVERFNEVRDQAVLKKLIKM